VVVVIGFSFRTGAGSCPYWVITVDLVRVDGFKIQPSTLRPRTPVNVLLHVLEGKTTIGSDEFRRWLRNVDEDGRTTCPSAATP